MRFRFSAPAALLLSSPFVSETCQKLVRGLEVGSQPVAAVGFGGVFIKMGLSVCCPSAGCLLVLQPGWRIVLQPGWRGSSVAAGRMEGTAFGSVPGCRRRQASARGATWCSVKLELGNSATAGSVACREPVSSLVQGRRSKNTSLFASSWS